MTNAERAARGRTSRTVVVVDNDVDARELAALDLSLDGHEVVAVGADGNEAIALCEARLPDVLVVDHRMPPGPWGLEVAGEVRRRFPDIRVILYTNYQSRELAASTRAVGAVYLPKGNLRALRRAVRGGAG